MPQPPLSKAFPACAEVSGREESWQRVRYKLPNGWSIKARGASSRNDRNSLDLLRRNKDLLDYLQAITITEEPGADFREGLESAWRSVPKPEVPWAVPGTAQTLKIDGRRSLLFLKRETSDLGKSESWTLLVDGGSVIFEVSSPLVFSPYQVGDGLRIRYFPERQADNELLYCAYWSVVRSLRFR